jgi:radical SAM superfamily enzyme YgiQ (UPF0313 family)
MVDILLIQPPIRDYYLTAKRTFPYGLASIAAAAERGGFSVAILDALATRRSREIARPDEMAHVDAWYGRPDLSPFGLFHTFRHYGRGFERIGHEAAASGAFLVGISSLFSGYSDEALRTAQAVKTWHPACRVVLGGHHPTALPEAAMASPAVDFVLRGEGEEALPMLARRLREGGALDDVPGIVFRRGDGTLHIAPPARVEDLERLPLPALHLTGTRFYRRHGRGAAVVVTSRGCPLNCSYCAVGRSSALRYRRRSVEAVIAEIAQAVGEYDTRFIDFEDENISLSRRWFHALLSAIAARFAGEPLELRAMNGLFPPTLDGGTVALMGRAGFKTLNLSLGSACPQQLRRFGRPDVRQAFDRALAAAEAAGLEAVGYIIVGAPDQDPMTSVADLLFLAQRRVLAGVSLFYPAPGSRDYDRVRELGKLPEHLSLLRSTALPLEHATSRDEAVTLLRLGRLLNFMKSHIDQGEPLPAPAPLQPGEGVEPVGDRRQLGIRLLQAFLHDGRLMGVTHQGEVYPHRVSSSLCRAFREGLAPIRLQSVRRRLDHCTAEVQVT